jgi:hypothetical protein
MSVDESDLALRKAGQPVAEVEDIEMSEAEGPGESQHIRSSKRHALKVVDGIGFALQKPTQLICDIGESDIEESDAVVQNGELGYKNRFAG